MIDTIKDTSQIIVSGHRGYKSAFPENTLLAFKEAMELGVDMLELDLRMSKDGQIVVIHDATVDRTTNGTGEVRDLTLEQIKALDAGSWMDAKFVGIKVPTFEEYCELMLEYPNVLLLVEIKTSPDAIATADEAIKLLNKYGLYERSAFVAFDGNVVAHLHDTYGAKVQGFKSEVMYNFIEGDGGTYSKMWAIAMEMKLLTAEDTMRFKAMGLQVWSYCPDTKEEVEYALECGTFLMTCNNPIPALQMRDQLNS